MARATKALDPTKPTAKREASGRSKRKPPVKAFIRRVQGGFAGVLLRRFVDADLMTQSAALALYAILSLAPLLLLLVWLTSALLPGTQDAVMDQVRLLAGVEAERVARTIVSNAQARPDTESIAGWWSVALLGRAAIAWYLQRADPGSAYGSMGTIVLALVWIYYAAPRRRDHAASASVSPLPPSSFGKSFSFGRPSRIGRTVSA